MKKLTLDLPSAIHNLLSIIFPMTFSLIVGLGNPGRQYAETRHNIGFMLLDRLAEVSGVCFQSVPKWQCHLAKLPDCGTLLLKPQTFMNLSGRAVRAAASGSISRASFHPVTAAS